MYKEPEKVPVLSLKIYDDNMKKFGIHYCSEALKICNNLFYKLN